MIIWALVSVICVVTGEVRDCYSIIDDNIFQSELSCRVYAQSKKKSGEGCVAASQYIRGEKIHGKQL